MINISDKEREKFYKCVFRDYFKRYEAKHYFRPMQELVENKFVTYYIKQPDYPLQYHKMVSTQRDIDWKNIEDKL